VKTVLRLVFVAGIVAGSVWLWTVFFPSPEKAIRQRLDQIAQTASFRPDETPLLVAGKAQKLAEFMSTNVEVTLESAGQMAQTLSGRDEVMQAAAGAHATTRSLVVQFLDIDVIVGGDKQSAVVNLTLKARADGENDLMVQPMKLTFRKVGRDWLITRVETVRALS